MSREIMKKVGIVVDNYRLKEMKGILTEAGFESTEQPFDKSTTSVIIETEEARVEEIVKICNEFKKDMPSVN